MLAGFESERARGPGRRRPRGAIASIRYVVPFDPGTVNGNDTSYRDRPGRHDTRDPSLPPAGCAPACRCGGARIGVPLLTYFGLLVRAEQANYGNFLGRSGGPGGSSVYCHARVIPIASTPE